MTTAIVFAYSEVGVRCVRELIASGVKIPLLFSHADDPNETQWFGSVQQLAKEHGLKVVTPDSPNTAQWVAKGSALEPDFVFSFYYRYMLDKAWLALPRLGALSGPLPPLLRRSGIMTLLPRQRKKRRGNYQRKIRRGCPGGRRRNSPNETPGKPDSIADNWNPPGSKRCVESAGSP